MTILKEELGGTVNLGLTVKTADGVLTVGDSVKMSADNEVEAVDANYDSAVGYVKVANTEASGKCTVATRGKAVKDFTTGEAYAVGSQLSLNSAGKTVVAQPANASASITVVNYSSMSTDTITVNGIVLTAGTDFSAATSNNVTALNLATAINNKVPGVKASAVAAVVTLQALTPGVVGNALTLADTMADAVALLSGATFTGGRDFFPMGMALEASTGADQTKSVLVY